MIAKNERHAIKLANDTKFGLGASIWTTNIEKGEKIAKEIEAGMVCINKVVSSDARLPFGGIKQSGIGRELSRYGVLEFANIKSIVVK
jgi:succinate-semialdehyde dehydrogenase/glutarate-semialdehyde dehydrogenase/succinyl-CoA reductase